MSLKDQIIADAAAVFLNEDDFAVSITHWPSGDSGSADSVVALVAFDKTEKVTKNGKRFFTKGTLQVSTTITATDADAWVINGITYQAVTVSPPEGGLVAIEIKYVEKKHTKLDRRTNY